MISADVIHFDRMKIPAHTNVKIIMWKKQF